MKMISEAKLRNMLMAVYERGLEDGSSSQCRAFAHTSQLADPSVLQKNYQEIAHRQKRYFECSLLIKLLEEASKGD